MKKRIAFVTNTMTVGGVERALIALLDQIDYEKYDVVLWTKAAGGAFESQINPHVEIRTWNKGNSRKDLINALCSGKLLRALKGIVYRLMLRKTSSDWVLYEYYEAKAQPICDEKSYDCVVAFQGLYSGVIATTKYRLKAPVKVAWIHGENSFTQKQRRFIEKEYHSFDKIFCVSGATKKTFDGCFPSAVNKTEVFYNLLDVPAIKEKADEAVAERLNPVSLVTVGRISKPKGQVMIPKATRILLDAGYDIHWYLVGDGELRAEVESEITKHGVEDRVILLGTKSNPYPYMKSCDIYVQPSFSEGWGLTVQEAKILHKPIVVTPLDVMREQIVSGENGLIVDAMTPEAIAEGVRTLLDNPELMEKFRTALQSESHDNTSELQKLYDLIES